MRLGSLLRATKKVKRGIGDHKRDAEHTPFPGGARIEIKGVQELKMLAGLRAQHRVNRQKMFLEVKKDPRKPGR